ncbi:MAG: RsmB/NOP family class I SAM-dependent RNA methyltransferase [Candidatus Anstonellales archaeon]
MKFSNFFSSLAERFGFDAVHFITSLLEQGTYFRVNTIKTSIKEFFDIADFDYEKTSYKYGFLYKGKEKIGKTLSYFLGFIHPQSFSSMMPVLAFNNYMGIFLDAASSPGSKTSQIAAIKENKAGIYSIEKTYERISLLVSNLDRLGVMNTCIIKADSRHLPFNNNYFDNILLDAPCSSFGSSLYAIRRANERHVKAMARIQKAMILSCFDALKTNGELVYSTCTITTEENEGVIDSLIEKRENAKPMHFSLPVKCEKGEHGFICSDYVKRIYPWHVNSEGFFIAKIKKI